MNTLVIARRGLVPALLAFGLGAQATPSTRSKASTPAATVLQEGAHGAVEQLDALIARLRASDEDRALVRELEAIAKALKARDDRTPTVLTTRATRRPANVDPVRAERKVDVTSPTPEVFIDATGRVEMVDISSPTPVVSVDATGRIETVDPVVEIHAVSPDGKVQVTAPAVKLRSSRSFPSSGIMTIGPEVIEYRYDIKPEVTLVRPDVRVEVVAPEVRTELPPVTRANPRAPTTGRRQVVEVEDSAPAPTPTTASLEAGLADIERELREIRELIEQIRRKAAQAPKKDR